MFIKGFKKTAESAVSMPTASAAQAAWAGANKPMAQRFSAGWANLKSELGLGKAQDTGHMGK